MTKKLDLTCPRCEGELSLTFDDRDDSSYIVDNEMCINVFCWECNITGTINVKVTDIDIVDEEAEEENDPEHKYRFTCLDCKHFFHYSRWESEKERKFPDKCDRCGSKNTENTEIEFVRGEWLNFKTKEKMPE